MQIQREPKDLSTRGPAPSAFTNSANSESVRQEPGAYPSWGLTLKQRGPIDLPPPSWGWHPEGSTPWRWWAGGKSTPTTSALAITLTFSGTVKYSSTCDFRDMMFFLMEGPRLFNQLVLMFYLSVLNIINNVIIDNFKDIIFATLFPLGQKS